MSNSRWWQGGDCKLGEQGRGGNDGWSHGGSGSGSGNSKVTDQLGEMPRGENSFYFRLSVHVLFGNFDKIEIKISIYFIGVS